MLLNTHAFTPQPKTPLSEATTYSVRGGNEQNAPMQFFGSFALASILAFGFTPAAALATEQPASM